MNTYDISMPVVKDKSGNYVHIGQINDNNRNDEYYCLACSGLAKPRAIKDDNKVQPHFYHVCADDCNQETIWHNMYKNFLFKVGSEFILVIDDIEEKHIVKEVLIEKLYNTKFGVYRPDTTVITNDDKTIFFELNYSSKKDKNEYFEKWYELGNDVVEIDVKSLYKLNYVNEIPKFDVIYHNSIYTGKYEKQHRSGIYYSTIAEYKNKYKDNVKEAEILDWFWINLQRYKRGKETEEYIIELFKSMNIEERDICLNIVKKLNCTELKQNMKIICYEHFKNYMFTDLHKFIGDDFHFEFTNFTPFKYRLEIYSNKYPEINLYNSGYYWDKKFVENNIIFQIKNPNGVFIREHYDLLDNSINDKLADMINKFVDYINRKIKHIEDERIKKEETERLIFEHKQDLINKLKFKESKEFINQLSSLSFSLMERDINNNLELYENICRYKVINYNKESLFPFFENNTYMFKNVLNCDEYREFKLLYYNSLVESLTEKLSCVCLTLNCSSNIISYEVDHNFYDFAHVPIKVVHKDFGIFHVYITIKTINHSSVNNICSIIYEQVNKYIERELYYI